MDQTNTNRLSIRKRLMKNVSNNNNNNNPTTSKLLNELEDQKDLIIKIVVIGESGSGKSNLIQRLVKNHFDERSPSTIGIDFSLFEFDCHNRTYHAQIWDTAGMERYRSSMTKIFYRDVYGAMLVFDLTKQEHFDALPRWLNEIRSNIIHCQDEQSDEPKFIDHDIPIILVGNKLDLVNYRQIDQTEAIKFVHRNHLSGYVETSAKTNENVHKAFQELFANILEQRLFKQQKLMNEKQKKQLSKKDRGTLIKRNNNRSSIKLTRDQYYLQERNKHQQNKTKSTGCGC